MTDQAVDKTGIEYGVDIIVLVLYQGSYRWYVSGKELWVMDYAKYVREFDAASEDYADRFDIGVLDAQSAGAFFEAMADYSVSTASLRDELRSQAPFASWDDVCHLFPSLFVDFGRRQLFSLFPEQPRLENYAPPGWIGTYDDFFHRVPDEQKYWVFDDTDVLEDLLKQSRAG